MKKTGARKLRARLIEGPLVTPTLASEWDLGHPVVQAPTAEGISSDLKIDGMIPKELNGDLYRVAPGQKHRDKSRRSAPCRATSSTAMLSRPSISCATERQRQGRFIATPERSTELAESRMLFNEFGTLRKTARPVETVTLPDPGV